MRHEGARNQESTTIVSQVEREQHENKKGIKAHFSYLCIVIIFFFRDLEEALSMGMDWSLREGIVLS